MKPATRTLQSQREVARRSAAPLAQLMVIGEWAQAAANANSDVGLDELGLSWIRRRYYKNCSAVVEKSIFLQ